MPEYYDVLIKDAKVVDGTGRAAFKGSVGIKGQKIAAVGAVAAGAARVIDGSGLVVCPGFVDTHSHADREILAYPLAENLVMQGITTFAGGNCGLNAAAVEQAHRERRSFDEWLSKVAGTGLSLNYVPLVGHNTIRRAVMAEDFMREASPREVEEMKRHVAEAMQSGAFGLSTGLDAAWPAHFANTAEIVALAKVAQEQGGFFAPHTRHHQNQWPAAHATEFGYGIFHAPAGEIIAGRYHGLLEAIEIARKANRIPVHIAHMTPAYIVPQPHPGFLDEALARATLSDIIDRPRDEGLAVTYNVIAWSHSIGSAAPLMASFFNPALLLPEWLKVMSKNEFAQQLETRAFRDRLKTFIHSGKFKFRMMHPLTDPYWMDCIEILRCKRAEYVGKTIGDIARERQPNDIIRAVYEESFEVVFDILAEDADTTCADIVDKREHGVLPVFLEHPAGTPCTDTGALPAQPAPADGVFEAAVSPTAYGLYPHYIRVFVKEKGTLSLEEAVRKATSMPAQEVLGLADRGAITEGAYADMILFDLERLAEGGDYLHPARPPEGIEYVLVNGTVVCEKNAHTGERPGKVLRHTA